VSSSAADSSTPPPGWWFVGRLGRPFQTRGALRLQAAGPSAAAVAQAIAATSGEVWLSRIGRTRLQGARRAGDGLALSFQGIYTPERARGLVHAELWVAPEHYPTEAASDPSERFPGATVLLDGEPYGRVERIVRSSQLLLVVTPNDGTAERWLPWGAPYLRWDGGALQLNDPPPGLLELD